MNRGAALAAALAAAAATGNALAADNPPEPLVTFAVAAESEVAYDRVTARLHALREGPDPAPLAAAVNAEIAWAIDRAREVPEVEASTGGYRTEPIYRERNLTGWRVRQTIQLTSADTGALAALVGRLQRRLALDGLEYRLSAAARARTEDALIGEAIDRFTQRAALIGKRLGRRYRIARIELSGGAVPPRPVPMRGLALAAESARGPALEVGTETVRISATGAIALLPEQ